jgi:AcrR family transcriptional regulator
MSGREESWELVHTKERIARVAVKLFSKKGFKGTTIKDIAREVGITEGAIYRHFTSKEDIIRHLTRRITEDLNELINREVIPQKSFREKVAKLVEVLVRYAFKNPDSFRYLTVYHILREEVPQEELPGRRILEIFRTAYTKGETDLIPEVALSMVIGSVDRVFILREIGLATSPEEELLEDLKKAVLRAVT